jgi:hypothetical protein
MKGQPDRRRLGRSLPTCWGCGAARRMSWRAGSPSCVAASSLASAPPTDTPPAWRPVGVKLEFDPEPRIVAEPADFARALSADPIARSACDRLPDRSETGARARHRERKEARHAHSADRDRAGHAAGLGAGRARRASRACFDAASEPEPALPYRYSPASSGAASRTAARASGGTRGWRPRTRAPGPRIRSIVARRVLVPARRAQSRHGRH